MATQQIPTSSIGGVNRLSPAEKRRIYSLLIPGVIKTRFNLNEDLYDSNGNDLLGLVCADGSASAEMSLRHENNFPDPILYGHITDTLSGRPHVLLYILNDPASPRFDVDRMPDGRATRFGTVHRNIEAEVAAMNYGLAPGQVRRGLRGLGSAIDAFEDFVHALGQDLYFVEPLYYHNAIIFENFGFSYQRGKKLMDRIDKGFSPQGDLFALLDKSSPFREPNAAGGIRLRSWAIHDGILGEPFMNVTMYKHIGSRAQPNRWADRPW